jgi:selenocysteine lyase/cysteine desulfurase
MDALLQLCPAHVGAGSLERADAADGTAQLWESGRRFEFGTRAHALYAGLGASIEWLAALGWGEIERYVAGMSDYIKERILERPHLELLTPRAFVQSAGLTTFQVVGSQAGEVSRELAHRGRIVVRVIPHYNGIRISTPCFVNEQDIDTLMAAVDEITASRA